MSQVQHKQIIFERVSDEDATLQQQLYGLPHGTVILPLGHQFRPDAADFGPVIYHSFLRLHVRVQNDLGALVHDRNPGQHVLLAVRPDSDKLAVQRQTVGQFRREDLSPRTATLGGGLFAEIVFRWNSQIIR